MANHKFVIARYKEDNVLYEVMYHLADTDAGKPVTGLNVGDLCWAVDTGVLYVATSTTAWKAIVKGDRSEWIPAAAFTENTGAALSFRGTYPNQMPYRSMSSSANTQLVASWRIPLDFRAIVSWEIVYDQPDLEASPTVWNLYLTGLGNGNNSDTAHTAATENSQSFPGSTTFHSMGAISTGVGAGSVVRIAVDRESAHANDTNTQNMQFLGLLVKYTS